MGKSLFIVILSALCFGNDFSQYAGKQWIDLSYANDDHVCHKLDIKNASKN